MFWVKTASLVKMSSIVFITTTLHDCSRRHVRECQGYLQCYSKSVCMVESKIITMVWSCCCLLQGSSLLLSLHEYRHIRQIYAIILLEVHALRPGIAVQLPCAR